MHRSTTFLIGVLILSFCLTGCAAQTGTTTPLKVTPQMQREQLAFPETIRISAPARQPETPKEYVQAGLFFFDRGAFAQAAISFEQAAGRVEDTGNPFYRACKKAEAVSWLVADERERFHRSVADLQASYSEYERLDLKSTDPQAWKLIQTAQTLKP